jgi:ceramide synthetase
MFSHCPCQPEALPLTLLIHTRLLCCVLLQLYGYFYSLGRYGLMATALLDTSNTLLHGAKALNYAEPAFPHLAGLKDATFKAFALSFLLCRVLAPPFALIKPGLLDGRAMPLVSYYITNGLLLIIYSLQLFWFTKIVRIALGGSPDGDEDSSNGSKPAKVVAAAAAGSDDARIKAE